MDEVKSSDNVDYISMEELAMRMGISLDRSHLPVAPPMELHCSRFAQTPDGTIPVNGHVSRCQSLYGTWCDKFNIDTSLRPIHLVDIAPKYDPISAYRTFTKDEVHLPDGRFVVEITDVNALASAYPNIVINYQIGAEEFCWLEDSPPSELLLGADYFFTDIDIELIDGFVESDKPNVIVIPNGNKSRFFKRLDLSEVHEIVANSGSGILSVVNYVDRETLFDYLDMASVVITTQSVTAMECLAIGLPVLLVRTSDDQNGRFVENGLAQNYNKEVLSFLLTNKDVRLAMGNAGKDKIKNNINKVVNFIYEQWKETVL